MSKNSGFLKDNFTAPILAGLMVLAPIGGKLGNIFGGSTAHAQDSAHAATLPPDFNKTPVSIQQPKISIPMFDARHIQNTDAIELKAAADSKGGIVLVIYGRDDQLFKDTVASYREAKEHDPNTPLVGIIVGPTDLPAGVDVVANGQTHNRTLLTNKNAISYIIEVAENRLEEQDLLASKLAPNNIPN